MVPINFNPSLSHPLYFIRKGLFNKISLYAPQLSGNLLDFGCGEKPYESLFTNVSSYTGLDYNSEGHSQANGQVINNLPPTFKTLFNSGKIWGSVKTCSNTSLLKIESNFLSSNGMVIPS